MGHKYSIINRLSILLFSLLGSGLFNSACRDQANGDIELVKEYLAEAYPIGSATFPGDLTYRDSVIKIIETPMLTKVSATKVYRSVLWTGNPEYEVLLIAIAVKPDKAMAVCMSPTYVEPNKEFVELFDGICTTEHESVELGRDLANVFKSITYRGSIRNIERSGSGISSKLYTGEQFWRLIDVKIEDNCIKGVSLSNPHSMQDE